MYPQQPQHEHKRSDPKIKPFVELGTAAAWIVLSTVDSFSRLEVNSAVPHAAVLRTALR